ncbi:MAG: D-aminoacyl-tRNA deacylase [Desulfobacterota bacterium]|jgi:D-tyrosyl-tRNA(Tyr) deacylase|nr:D-aminoacyl-tRNA deacylase [Thermodesulfobacteriota bacterium]
MRLVIQRVKQAAVRIQEETVGEIGPGLLLFLGVGEEDTEEDVGYLVEKVRHLRVFADGQGRFNLSVTDVRGALLIVSQFTLWGDCRKGRRPSFSHSAPPRKAEPLYDLFIQKARAAGLTVASGRFQEMMEVSLVNDGPVTLLLDSRKQF